MSKAILDLDVEFVLADVGGSGNNGPFTRKLEHVLEATLVGARELMERKSEMHDGRAGELAYRVADRLVGELVPDGPARTDRLRPLQERFDISYDNNWPWNWVAISIKDVGCYIFRRTAWRAREEVGVVDDWEYLLIGEDSSFDGKTIDLGGDLKLERGHALFPLGVTNIPRLKAILELEQLVTVKGDNNPLTALIRDDRQGRSLARYAASSLALRVSEPVKALIADFKDELESKPA